MRALLISAAVLVLAVPAAAQPSDPSQIRGKGGFGQYQQQQAQQAQPGGPTNFTNQVTGAPPGPGLQPRQDGNRGDRRGPQAQPQPTPQPQLAAPQDRNRDDRNRGNWQGRGDRDRGGYDNRRDNDNRAGNRGARHDWRSYGNYHRDWRPSRRFRAPVYHRPSGWYARRWTFGEFLPRLFWARDYWLDYRLYDLPPPPYGAVWVRVNSDALLIDDDSGEIITVAYNVFY